MNQKQLKAKQEEISKMGLNDVELLKAQISMSDFSDEDKTIKDSLYSALYKREKELSTCGGAMVETGDPSEMEVYG